MKIITRQKKQKERKQKMEKNKTKAKYQHSFSLDREQEEKLEFLRSRGHSLISIILYGINNIDISKDVS